MPPVVELWWPNVIHPHAEVVDLNREPDLEIVRPLPYVELPHKGSSAEQQLPQEFWE